MAAGEESIYTYNGLGALMENTWIIAKNAYGYHGVNASTSDNESTNGQGNGNSSGNTAGNNGNGNVKKTSTVIKQFVVDFTSETFDPLMEHEVNGLDYRYVYSDKARLSVVVQGIENGSASLLDEAGELHAYYHTDYLGTTDYLTSAVNSKVISWTYYNEWGEITHSAVLNCGARELDLVKLYATHDFDAVLTQYYAKARFYDVDNRRFTAVDPILDPSQYDISEYATDPMQLVQYLYVKDNAVNWIDPLGLYYIFKDSNGEYYAVPENATISGLAVVADEMLPVIGDSAADLVRSIQNKGAVSGNSLANDKGNSATVGKAIMEMDEEFLTEALEDSIEKAFGEVGKELTGFVGTTYGIVELLKAVGDSGKIPQVDSVVFKLFEMEGIVPKAESLEELEVIMEAATAYVQAGSWLFSDASYTDISMFLGTPRYSYGPTLFSMLQHLNAMDAKGKSDKKIKQEIESYFSAYACATWRNSTLDSLVHVIKPAQLTPYYNGPVAKPSGYIYTPAETESYVYYALNNYQTAVDDIAESFGDYVSSMRKMYTGN